MVKRGTRWVRIPKKPKSFPDYGEGRCLYCGDTLKGQQRRYCSSFHGERYRYMINDYRLVNWGSFREIILKRDKKTCQDCGAKAQQVHHIVPIYLGGEEFDEANCTSLCKVCHKIRHESIREDLKKPKTTIFDFL